MIQTSMDFYQSLGTAAPSSSPARGPFATPRVRASPLGIPYKVVNIVSGELNDAAAKKYDLEA